jgi:tyrosyl-tRNA synthetase
MDFATELNERGLIYQHSADTLADIVNTPRTLYMGIDPTGDSLHVGNLVQLMTVRRFFEHGHNVIVLVGGGTSRIGDPSGKSEERTLMDEETIAANTHALAQQIQALLASGNFTLVDNAEWLTSLTTISFLRDVGKYFTVNTMLQRESVQQRMQTEQGMSYTEFSYMLLQAYDYLHLNRRIGVDLQVGGSDQWGNIAAGIDLIRRQTGETVHGVTTPLLIDKRTGRKFGKTEHGTVWLDPEKTSPYQFYQFWYNLDDESVIEYLKIFTMRSLEEIESLAQAVRDRPKEREAQRSLARDVTTLVHGEDHARKAENVSAILFRGGDIETLSDDERALLIAEVPSVAVSEGAFAEGVTVANLLAESPLAASKSEAKRLVDEGGVSLNDISVTDPMRQVQTEDFINGVLLLKRGKKSYCVAYRDN